MIAVLSDERDRMPISTMLSLFPCVITGFEAIDMMQGVLLLLRQLTEGRAEVQNQYSRTVTPQGNVVAQELIDQVYTPCDAQWRGLGIIPASGLAVRVPYADATRFRASKSVFFFDHF